MDETPAYFDMIRSNTLEFVGTYTVDLLNNVHEKNSFSLVHIVGHTKPHSFLSAFKNIGVQSLYVPPGFTESLQPLDVSVNKPVKEILREE